MDSDPPSVPSLERKFWSSPLVLIPSFLSVFAITFGLLSLFGDWQARDLSVSNPDTTSQPDTTFPQVTITVDIEGGVVNPGIYSFTQTSGDKLRLEKVISQAGGLSPSADSEYVSKNLNLAATVADGMKIYIPKVGEAQTADKVAGKMGINVNLASLETLETLQGVGAVRAQGIIDNRPYSSLEELGNKSKLPASVIDNIRDQISF